MIYTHQLLNACGAVLYPCHRILTKRCRHYIKKVPEVNAEMLQSMEKVLSQALG